MEELIHIDNLCNRCGFFTPNTPVEGGYGCNHKDCDDGEYVFNGEIIDWYKARLIISKLLTKRNIKCNRRLAKKYIRKAELVMKTSRSIFGVKYQGACSAYNCPLGYVANKEDFIRFGEDPGCMSEDEWVVIENSALKEKEIKSC